MLVNIDLWGSDIGYDSNIQSWEECGQKCLLRSDCDSFTWNSRSKRCIKKRGVPAQRGYEGAFSGTAECLKSSSVSSTIVSDTTTTTGTIVTTSTTGIISGLYLTSGFFQYNFDHIKLGCQRMINNFFFNF